MFGMGHWEILIIFILILILFGAKRLPELAHALGKSIKEFKHATQGLKDEFDMDKIDERPQSTNIPPQSGVEKKADQVQSSQKSPKK